MLLATEYPLSSRAWRNVVATIICTRKAIATSMTVMIRPMEKMKLLSRVDRR
jgi:hypothetical protein